MKYVFFTVAIVIIYFQVQDYTSYESTLNRSLDNYKTALLEKDAETVIDYVYPMLYTNYASKEELYEKQKKIFESKTFTDFEFTPAFPIKTYSDGVYIVVKYREIVTINMKPLGTKDKDKDKRARTMALFFLRDSLNKGDTLHVDESNNMINITKHGTFLFLNKNQNGWKYIDVEGTPKKLFKQILPMDIIDKEQVLILKQRDTMFQELFQNKVRK